MNYLVTGAAGFIGSNLSEKLLKDGHNVFGIDNFDPFYKREIKEHNLKKLKIFETFKFAEFDLEDEKKLRPVLDGNRFDVIIHLAAKAGVRPSLKAPLAYVDSNIKASVNLLNLMHKTNHRKLVFASSSSIYGKSKVIPFKEDVSFDHAISVYATSKQAGELYNKMFHNLYGIDVINLRFFTVYGPGQRPDLAIHKFLKANLKRETIQVFGDGSMARDYTYVDDTVEGIKGAISRIQDNHKLYETFNLGNSSPVSLNELLDSIEKACGKENIIERTPVPPGDVPITFADISRSKELLGYDPKVDLKTGLENMFKWIKEIY